MRGGHGFQLFIEQYVAPVLDQDLNDHVGKLDVHDGCDGLLLGPEEGGAEAHPEVGNVHHVLVGLGGHFVEMGAKYLEHPLVWLGNLANQPFDFINAFLIGFQF